MRHENLSLMFDCVGIGIGPSNLSLACLLDPISDYSCCFLEQKESFVWHENLLLKDASIQISILKDLVSLADPRSKYSFISFLHENNRLYHFINANFTTAKRQEFNQYFQWVCTKLNNLLFSNKVEKVEFDKCFHIQTEKRTYLANNIAIGIGQTPFIPQFAENIEAPTIFHASQFLKNKALFANKKVVVVGGGQSGAEIFLNLISKDNPPISCQWISRRSNFFPLDDSPFSNEFFMPAYCDYFSRLPQKIRNKRLTECNLLNNGISADNLKDIYQAVYKNNFLSDASIEIVLTPGREVKEIEKTHHSWRIIAANKDTQEIELYEADIIILATGYTYKVPYFLDPLADKLRMCGNELLIQDDFSVAWDGPQNNRIYIQNQAVSQKGIADPNLSLIAWRNGKISNSLLHEKIYKIDDSQPLISWPSPSCSTLVTDTNQLEANISPCLNLSKG